MITMIVIITIVDLYHYDNIASITVKCWLPSSFPPKLIATTTNNYHHSNIDCCYNNIITICLSIYVWYIYIYLFILHGYITNSQYDQLPVGLTAQLVEQSTSIAEVMGSNPVQAWNFFQAFFSQLRGSFFYLNIVTVTMDCYHDDCHQDNWLPLRELIAVDCHNSNIIDCHHEYHQDK